MVTRKLKEHEKVRFAQKKTREKDFEAQIAKQIRKEFVDKAIPQVKTVVIPYKPRELQKEFHANRKRWNVVVCHRRFGKTVMCINELIKAALEIPDSRFAYIAPTYKQSKNIAWDILKQFAKVIPGVKFTESELRCDFSSGSRITLYGADNPDSLRGVALWGAVYDEYAQQPSNIHSEIIRPALADHKGWAIWIGTPKGQNAFWELYKYATEKGDDTWYSMLITAERSKHLDEAELLDAKRSMSLDEYEQEFNCSFTAAIRGAYYAKELSWAYANNRMVKSLYDKTLPVYTFWDIGISDYTCVLFVQINGNEIRIVDSYQNNGYGLEHYVDVIKDRKYTYEKHFFPHDIEVRELGSGMSRLEIMQKMLGHSKVRKVKNIKLKDGIDAGRFIFDKLYFDVENTQELRNCLSQYTQEWDDKAGMFRDRPKHDWTSHFADAFRYMAVTYRHMTEQLRPDSLVIQDYGMDSRFGGYGRTTSGIIVNDFGLSDYL